MKKALCILLSLIMLLSASTTAFASEMIDKSFCVDDYNQYTIKLFDETLHTRSTTENTIDTAISYVKSLNLTVTGVSGTSAVHYGSYNQYVEQFTNTVTRTIFKEKSTGKFDPCYQDQTSSLRVKLYFCPVGTAFSSDYIEISDVYNGSVKANDLTKDEILHTANAYSNHGGEIIYRVSYHRVTEDWNN